MAMTKTTTLTEINITPETVWINEEGVEGRNPTIIHAVYRTVIDDPEDDQLPLARTFGKNLVKTTITRDDEGNEIVLDTDVSGEDQLVQDICAVIWA